MSRRFPSAVLLGLDPSTQALRTNRLRGWTLGASPRVTAIVGVAALTLAACGEREAAPAGEGAPAAAPAPITQSEPTIELTETGLRDVCRAVLSVVHEQQPPNLRADGVADGVVSLSWPAPVDGGRRTAECRVSGDVVSWRPTGLPDDGQERWMDSAQDPILRFEQDGQTIIVIQTLPDGSTSRQDVALNGQEAR